MLNHVDRSPWLKRLSRTALLLAAAGLLTAPTSAFADRDGGRNRGGEYRGHRGGGQRADHDRKGDPDHRRDARRHDDRRDHRQHQRRDYQQHQRRDRSYSHDRGYYRGNDRYRDRGQQNYYRHHHRSQRGYHDYSRGYSGYYGPRVVQHGYGHFYCAPCSHYFDDRDHFYSHLHGHHHLSLVAIPFALVEGVVHGLFGWIFYG